MTKTANYSEHFAGPVYVLTVAHDSDSDIQPTIACLSDPMVKTVQGIDTNRVRVTLRVGANTAAFEALLDSDGAVLRYSDGGVEL